MSYEYAIEFHNVTKAYGELQAIDNLNLSIKKGIIFGLVGASGAGKSTLLRTINKLEDIQGGEIIVQGNDITNLRGKELRYYRQKVGMIFQHFSLLDSRNVFNNIALPLECNGFKKDEIARRVNELADRLLLLYQERQKVKGFSFKIEDALQANFENKFPYELTLDQEKAIKEIKADMESSVPMDHLLCGDVGFGKTEVAFRAAFKALTILI